jgi:hypothetical protein
MGYILITPLYNQNLITYDVDHFSLTPRGKTLNVFDVNKTYLCQTFARPTDTILNLPNYPQAKYIQVGDCGCGKK